MNRKIIWLSSLAVALLGLNVVRGQGPYINSSPSNPTTPNTLPMPSTINTSPTPGTLAPQPDVGMPPPPGQQFTLQKWSLGESCPGCCGPMGGNGPIGAELYLRTGVSFPINGGALSQGILTGWDIEGGVTSLFFNRADDAAWTVGVSVTSVFNVGNPKAGQVTLTNVPLKTTDITGTTTTTNVPSLNVTPSNLNRTSVNLSGGRETWLLGTADSSHNDLNWRVGWDVGGRWGTEKLDLDELQHRNGQFGGVFVGLSTDLEVPCGNVILVTGIRTEWGTDFSRILQSDNNGNVMDLNLMFNIGIRF